MATYQILHWQDIPSQIKAWDDHDEVVVDRGRRFMARIDHIAQTKGLTGADEYLGQWHWSEEEERKGTAAEVAEALKKELEKPFA